MRNFLKSFIFSFIWMVVIIILSLLPTSNLHIPKVISIPHLDKLAHMFMYFVYTLLLIFGYRIYNQRSFKKSYYLISFVFAIILGGVTEVAQGILFSSFNRQKDLMDFLANSFGATLALIICYLKIDVVVWNWLFRLFRIKLQFS